MLTAATAYLRDDLQASAASSRRPRPLPLPAIVVAGLAIALVVSTQFLFQPFVWRHWPIDEVLLGWFEVLRDRTVVALSIVLAFAATERLPVSHVVGRSAAIGLGIAVGAAVGEATLTLMGAPAAAGDAVTLLGRVLRWSAVAASVAALHQTWVRLARTDGELRRVELDRLDGENQLAHLRLQALRAQIEPHFLFNTLATVRRLATTDRSMRARLLDHLHTFIRLSSAAHPAARGWTLQQEIDLVRAYLGVAAVRMAGRLQVTIDADATLAGTELPPLMLATLVENAVKHGITPSTEPGAIVIGVHGGSGSLDISVADTGVGFRATAGTGIGLANTRARLRTLYGGAATLTLRANQPSGVVASLHLPVMAKVAR